MFMQANLKNVQSRGHQLKKKRYLLLSSKKNETYFQADIPHPTQLVTKFFSVQETKHGLGRAPERKLSARQHRGKSYEMKVGWGGLG